MPTEFSAAARNFLRQGRNTFKVWGEKTEKLNQEFQTRPTINQEWKQNKEILRYIKSYWIYNLQIINIRTIPVYALWGGSKYQRSLGETRGKYEHRNW